jgi:DNA-binding NtrC family response regulator
VVDDEHDLAYLFKDALTQIESIDAIAFTNPVIALEHFRLNHRDYAAVVADYRMPGMNEDHLLNKIKQIDPSVVRIMVSAFEVDDGVFKDCQCIDKYLQKPVRMVDLIFEVQKCVPNEATGAKLSTIF